MLAFVMGFPVDSRTFMISVAVINRPAIDIVDSTKAAVSVRAFAL
jgi:hypothetical protein